MDQTLKDSLNQILGPAAVLVLPQLSAGVALVYAIGKMFKFVEDALTDDTKLEIAVWLLDRKPLSPSFRSWPDTFAKVFDRMFGESYLGWRFVSRSMLFSIGALILSTIFIRHLFDGLNSRWELIFLVASILGNVVPGYISLASTRYWIRKTQTSRRLLFPVLVGAPSFSLLCACLGSVFISMPLALAGLPATSNSIAAGIGFIITFLGLFVCALGVSLLPILWLWLYAGAGFVLIAARRFDIGFDWFNRKLDIEKHPLQSIGLVAGALVALIYWAAVIVNRMI